MVLHGTANRLQEVQNLSQYIVMTSKPWQQRNSFSRQEETNQPTNLEHAIAVGIRDVDLESSKVGRVVVMEVELFNAWPEPNDKQLGIGMGISPKSLT